MSSATAPVFKPLSITDSCPPSLFASSSSESSHPYLPIPLRPVKIHLSCSSSSFAHSTLASHPLRKTHLPNFVAFVAETSGWAQQDEDNTVTTTLDQEQEQEQEEGGEPGWENQETEAQVSDWEGGGESNESGDFEEGEGGVGEEEGEGGGEGETFVEPPEEAKLFVGNLPYDVDSQKLAMLFEQAGTVEIAEVNPNFTSSVLAHLCMDKIDGKACCLSILGG